MESIKKMKWVSAGIAALALLITGCEGESSSDSSSATGGGGTTTTGIGGSTARMVIVNNYLYAIAGDKIQLFNITTPSAPSPWNKITIDWDIQTLYPYRANLLDGSTQDYLLVGAADGVHILDNSDPASPREVGDFMHATAIDPVVASDGYAYVTLKNDPNAFTSIEDQMSIISLADPTDPQLENVIPMQSPEGLSVINKRLFVCDGIAGLKQFDLGDPVYPTIVDVVPQIDCNDVIAVDDILYVITDNSLRQYDRTVSPPALLSIIETDEMSPDALVDLLDFKLQSDSTTFSEL